MRGEWVRGRAGGVLRSEGKEDRSGAGRRCSRRPRRSRRFRRRSRRLYCRSAGAFAPPPLSPSSAAPSASAYASASVYSSSSSSPDKNSAEAAAAVGAAALCGAGAAAWLRGGAAKAVESRITGARPVFPYPQSFPHALALPNRRRRLGTPPMINTVDTIVEGARRRRPRMVTCPHVAIRAQRPRAAAPPGAAPTQVSRMAGRTRVTWPSRQMKAKEPCRSQWPCGSCQFSDEARTACITDKYDLYLYVEVEFRKEKFI